MAQIPQQPKPQPTSGGPPPTPSGGPPGAGPGSPTGGNAAGAPPAVAGLPTQPGLQVAYFAFKENEAAPAEGLFRIADDPDAKVLVMERFTPDGEWVDDPKLIDDLHEPGVFSVDDGEAQSIMQDILSAQDSAPVA